MSGRKSSAAPARRKAAGSTGQRKSALLPALLMVALGGAATGILISMSREAGPVVRTAQTPFSEKPAAVSSPKAPEGGKARPAPATRTESPRPSSAGRTRLPAPPPASQKTAPERIPSPSRPHTGPDGGQVALTFDAGATAEPGWDILKTLGEHSIRCTFFLTGRFAQRNPELVKAIVAGGHDLGNHTFSHPDLRKLNDDAIREELRRAEEVISGIAGISTRPWFRPPFGSRDGRVLSVAAEEGYQCVYWTLDSWDSYKKGITAEELRERVLGRIRPGGVVLFHIGSRATADALPDILDELDRRGLRCVPVSQLGAPLPR